MRMYYEYQTQKNGVQIRMGSNGTIIGVTSAVGRLIQELFNRLPDGQKQMFRAMIQGLVKDDSPIWKANEGEIRIDLDEFKKQVRDLYDEP